MNAEELQRLSPEFVLSPPASAEDLAALQDWFGHQLPPQLVSFLLASNGISFRNPYGSAGDPPEQWIQGCRQIIQDTEMTRRIWADARPYWREQGYADSLGNLLDYLMFASTFSGDVIAYRVASEGSQHALVLIDHETGDVDAIDRQDLFDLLPALDPFAIDR